MRAKKVSCFFTVLLLFLGLICSVDASSDTTASFRSDGVTIELTYPEEANPAESIWHNVTLTSIVATTLRNFTVVIKAPVNSSWVEILNSQDTFSKPLPLAYNLSLSVPQDANGMLQCFISVNTSNIDDLSTTVYTTLVSDPTFSEMLVDYAALQADYATLQNKYDRLWVNYTSLFDNYTALVSEYNTLSDQYDAQVAKYQKLLGDYDILSNAMTDLDEGYRSLDSDYWSKSIELGNLTAKYDGLNATLYSLQGNFTNLERNYTSLKTDYNALDQAYTDLLASSTHSESALGVDRIVMFIFVVAVVALIVFIVYLRRKQEEPYVVIRKETVSVKSEEES